MRKPMIMIAMGGLIAASVLFFGVFSRGGNASSAPNDLNLPAISNISGVKSDGNFVAVPAALRHLPPDVGPTSGAVHRLGGGILAWLNDERVCAQDSNGNGGCFAAFDRGCNCTVADPDELGNGKPVVITGLVPDGASSIEIVTKEQSFRVPLTGNGFSFELGDATIRPWNVTGARVTLADGTTSYVQLGSGAAPAGLKEAARS